MKLIPSIINRFRFGKFGATADIKKAFLQIGLQERDRPFIRFLWKDRGKEETIKILQHNRVVFGKSSSPFLLGATFELHLKNASAHLQETALKLMKSFYVDNCVFSVNREEELVKAILESQALLTTAKFEARGWKHSPTESEFEELYTVLCDAESIINSRFLRYMSENMEDLIGLTPAMFLQQTKEIGLPDLDHVDDKRMNKVFIYS